MTGSETRATTEILPKYEVSKGDQVPEWIVNEAWLINEALDKGKITRKEAETGLTEDSEILGVMRDLVEVTYFVEYPPENVGARDRGEMLQELFNQEFEYRGRMITLLDYLAEKGQGISLAMSSLDESTAQAIRQLNERGIPVVGWVVVDDVEGYWTNPTNIAQTAEKAEEFNRWADENGLQFRAIGFDLEKPIEYIKALAQGNIVRLIRQIRQFRRKKGEQKKEFGDPEALFRQLVDSLEEAGQQVEIYSFPRGTHLLMSGMGVYKGEKGREVQMLYTTSVPRILSKLMLRFLRKKDAIAALGIVSGREGETPGRDLTPGKLPPHLTVDELASDISTLLDQELNLDERKLSLRNLYLFALNTAHVAMMMEGALHRAFERQAK